MDSEIVFGEIEETPPRPELRPDRNRHYAVAPCGAPDEQELPIFVDLDVMRDMEAHAQSDTRVELGGVLLGGQYQDEQGRPFVVVSDSLRASHYEATKGSFKFTHETWQKISRERDEFPAELQMVGWYHTHPDWGVFLSGMDLFICDNFFNKPLDVALVIDPCRDDRGWFQWTGDPRQRVRRTGGFYLIASRFRKPELDCYRDQLEGKYTMPTDTRYGGSAPPPGMYGAPIVNVAADRGGSWQAPAMFGLLAMQFLFLGLLAFKLFSPGGAGAEKQAAEIAALRDVLNEERSVHRAAAKADAQLEVLDRVLGSLHQTPEGFAKMLEAQQSENDELKAAVRGQMALARELDRKNSDLQRTLSEAVADANVRQEQLDGQISGLNKDLLALRSKFEKQTQELAVLQRELDTYRPKKEGEADQAGWLSGWNLVWIGVAGAALALLAVGGLAAAFYRGAAAEQEEQDRAAKAPAAKPMAAKESGPSAGQE